MKLTSCREKTIHANNRATRKHARGKPRDAACPPPGCACPVAGGACRPPDRHASRLGRHGVSRPRGSRLVVADDPPLWKRRARIRRGESTAHQTAHRDGTRSGRHRAAANLRVGRQHRPDTGRVTAHPRSPDRAGKIGLRRAISSRLCITRRRDRIAGVCDGAAEGDQGRFARRGVEPRCRDGAGRRPQT